jgi:hypothetical protein
MYTELLQLGQGGSMRVIERLVWLRHATVPRNAREPSKKVMSPSVCDVDSPHCDVCTWKAEQHRHVLKTHRHLAGRQGERVRFCPPPV